MINKILNRFCYENYIFLLTIILVSSFTIFGQYIWGKYLFLFVSLIIFIIYTIRKNFKIIICFEKFQRMLLVFSLYMLFSSLWAINTKEVISNVVTHIEILFCFSLVYSCYTDIENKLLLIRALKWSGYIIAIYSILIYGWSGLLSATLSVSNRLSSEFANINVIGMLCALSCYIEIYELLYEKKTVECVFMIPAILVINATQSRKAILFLILGIFGLIFFKCLKSGNILKLIGGILVMILLAIIFYDIMSKIPFFNGAFERLNRMINIFGNGKVDSSTLLRNRLISIGITIWKQNPLGGVGIGCSHVLVNKMCGIDLYIHNNFLELLSGGGIIAFCLYYRVYVDIFFNLFRGKKNNLFYFLIIWILLVIIMDYGMVTYYTKIQWFYIMIMYLVVRDERRF